MRFKVAIEGFSLRDSMSEMVERALRQGVRLPHLPQAGADVMSHGLPSVELLRILNKA